MGRQYSGATRADPFQHQLVSSILCPPYQGMGSPAKHVTVVAQQPPQLQIQPPIISQQVAAQQQYVPVSMVEPSGRQMLLTNAVQTSWPTTNRQMAIVPSWQQLPPQHAAIQQPLLSDAGEWGRPLIVDSAAILQEQRPVFGVDVAAAAAAAAAAVAAEAYNPTIAVDGHTGTAAWTSSSSSKRGSKQSSHQQQQQQQSSHHHLSVPGHHGRSAVVGHIDKKEQTQLSPVKKRVKESTPPDDHHHGHHHGGNHHQQQHHHQTQQHNNHHGHGHGQHAGYQTCGRSPHGGAHWQTGKEIPTVGRQHTITIHDTPSPAVSVITISDSEDETCGKPQRVQQQQQQPQQPSSSNRQRKNVISCVTVADSDGEEHRSPAKAYHHHHNQHQQQQVIKHEPQQHHYASSQSQKKRLLAKAQSECMLNVPTKQEPGTADYHHHRASGNSSDYSNGTVQHNGCGSQCTSGSHYQHDQQYTNNTNDKRVSWAPPAAHVPSGSSSNHRRHSAVPLVNLRDYQLQCKTEYAQPPAAHSTGREAPQHLVPPASGKVWSGGGGSGNSQPAIHQQGYRHAGSAHLSPQPLASAARLSPQHALAAAAGQPLYHQSELYRRPAVYVTTAQPAAYLPATHQVAPFTPG